MKSVIFVQSVQMKPNWKISEFLIYSKPNKHETKLIYEKQCKNYMKTNKDAKTERMLQRAHKSPKS